MGQRTEVTNFSDLSATDATEDDGVDTHTMTIDGRSFEVDTLDSEWQGVLASLEEHLGVDFEHTRAVTAAAPAPTRAPRRSSAQRGTTARGEGEQLTRDEAKACRDWCRTHGVTISDRGRVPNLAIEAWRAGDPSIAAGHQPDTSRTKGTAQDGAQEPEHAAQGPVEPERAPDDDDAPGLTDAAAGPVEPADDHATPVAAGVS